MQEQVKYKKYFYALRPLLACQYIEQYNSVPPVLFDDLLQMDLPKGLRQEIDELLEVKKVTDEKEVNPHIPVIIDFIKTETKRQKQLVEVMEDDRRKEWDTLNQLFLDILSNV